MTQIAQSRSTGIRPNHPALAVAGRVILYVVLIALALFTLIPFVWMLSASLKLDREIMDELMAFRKAVASGRLDVAEDTAGSVKNLVLKRDYTYSDTAELEEHIAELEGMTSSSSSSASRPTSVGLKAQRSTTLS